MSTRLNYWITHIWSSVVLADENIIHKGFAFLASDDASAIWISGDFYIRVNSKTRWRPVSRSADHSYLLCLPFADRSFAEHTFGWNKRRCTCKTRLQRGFLFAWCGPSSLVPLLLSAREIRYEVYSCIFEDLSWILPDKVSRAMLTFSRGSTRLSKIFPKLFWFAYTSRISHRKASLLRKMQINSRTANRSQFHLNFSLKLCNYQRCLCSRYSWTIIEMDNQRYS